MVAARAALAERHRIGFQRAVAGLTGVSVLDVRVVTEPPDDTPFGRRLTAILRDRPPSGLVLLGSGALPLAQASDRAAFVRVAAARGPRRALANNRYSADVVALNEAAVLLGAGDLPTDNALPRWLAEAAGFQVDDLRSRWRLGVDIDGPLDLLLVGAAPRIAGSEVARTFLPAARELTALATPVPGRLGEIREILADPRAEVLVAGRSSAGVLGWLERTGAGRTRALIEERGLRASRVVPPGADGGRGQRPPRSVLGLLLDRDGPESLGGRLAELGDAALIDTRVLLAHRLGAHEAAWPSPEDRFASDLLLADRVSDPWLRALTASAAMARIPILLGGHSLVGPGLRLVADRTGPRRRARLADVPEPGRAHGARQ